MSSGISAIFILDARGDAMISRIWRDGVQVSDVDAFRCEVLSLCVPRACARRVVYVCVFACLCGHSVTLIFSFRQFARLESERVALADAQGHWRRDVSLHQSRVGLRGGGRQGRQRRLRNGV